LVEARGEGLGTPPVAVDGDGAHRPAEDLGEHGRDFVLVQLLGAQLVGGAEMAVLGQTQLRANDSAIALLRMMIELR